MKKKTKQKKKIIIIKTPHTHTHKGKQRKTTCFTKHQISYPTEMIKTLIIWLSNLKIFYTVS